MTNETIKRMFDACYKAKRVREMLPPLPKGVMPSFIHYLDVIKKLEATGVQVKISDISNVMNIPRPGVTRTVKDMESNGYLKKIASPTDKRITYITLTASGKKLSQKYDEDYFTALVPYLDNIPEENIDITVNTIEMFYEVMNDRRKDFE